MVASSKFEISITIIIVLNMILNAAEYFSEGLEYENNVNVVNTIFVTLHSYLSNPVAVLQQGNLGQCPTQN